MVWVHAKRLLYRMTSHITMPSAKVAFLACATLVLLTLWTASNNGASFGTPTYSIAVNSYGSIVTRTPGGGGFSSILRSYQDYPLSLPTSGYDVVICGYHTAASTIATAHANGESEILVYCDAATPSMVGNPGNQYLLKDAGGNIIYGASYGGRPYLDIGSSYIQNYIATWIKAQIDAKGFDGVMLDDCMAVTVGRWLWDYSNHWSDPLINPRTNQPWTDQQVSSAYTALQAAVKNAIGSKFLLCNGMGSGSSTPSDYAIMLSAAQIDGISFEQAFKGNWLTLLNSIDYLQQNYPNSMPCIVCNAGSAFVLGTMQLVHRTSMTCLGCDQSTLNTFNGLGNPIGDYYTNSGVYYRQFQNGLLWVNPSSQTAGIS